MLVDVAKQALDKAVVGLDKRSRELVVGEFEAEVHLGKSSALDRLFLGIVAKELAHQNLCRRVTGLKSIFAVDICGKANCGAFEEYARKRYGLARICIRHGAADLGGLGKQRCTGEEHTQNKSKSPHKGANIAISHGDLLKKKNNRYYLNSESVSL